MQPIATDIAAAADAFLAALRADSGGPLDPAVHDKACRAHDALKDAMRAAGVDAICHADRMLLLYPAETTFGEMYKMQVAGQLLEGIESGACDRQRWMGGGIMIKRLPPASDAVCGPYRWSVQERDDVVDNQ